MKLYRKLSAATSCFCILLSSSALAACHNQSKQEEPDSEEDNPVTIGHYAFDTYPELLNFYEVYERRNAPRFVLPDFDELEGGWKYDFVFAMGGKDYQKKPWDYEFMFPHFEAFLPDYEVHLDLSDVVSYGKGSLLGQKASFSEKEEALNEEESFKEVFLSTTKVGDLIYLNDRRAVIESLGDAILHAVENGVEAGFAEPSSSASKS